MTIAVFWLGCYRYVHVRLEVLLTWLSSQSGLYAPTATKDHSGIPSLVVNMT